MIPVCLIRKPAGIYSKIQGNFLLKEGLVLLIAGNRENLKKKRKTTQKVTSPAPISVILTTTKHFHTSNVEGCKGRVMLQSNWNKNEH